MLGRRPTIGAALMAGCALCLTTAPERPAAARTQRTDLEGSYMGTFTTHEGNIWQGDLTVTLQVGARLGGILDVAAIHQGVLVSGSISSSNRLLISGRMGGLGQPISRIKIHAVYRPDGVAQAPDGTLYICDSQKGRVWRVVYTGAR